MNPDALHDDIERIDARLAGLIEERLERSILAARAERKAADGSERVDSTPPAAALRGATAATAQGPSGRALAGSALVRELLDGIDAASRAAIGRELRLVGFQGEHGAYSEAAALAWDPEIVAMPRREFTEVFDAVEEGLFDYGIVPVENTLGGLVGPVNSILVYTGLRVVAAVDMPVSHCLLASPGADYREIRSVYSHSQALAQCRLFLHRNALDPMPYYDTAGAARMIAEERPKGAAALASALAAELYGLEIIKEGVQDGANNRTRFFVIAKGDGDRGSGSKCSAVFFTEDKAGALFRTLEIFARAGINLTRIESVPNAPGDYAIFIDFEGSAGDPRVAEALGDAEAATRDFRLLGCYDERRL